VRSNTLDAFIRLLRDKVDGVGEPKLIQTVRGVGGASPGIERFAFLNLLTEFLI
jgi:hypothetical protein